MDKKLIFATNNVHKVKEVVGIFNNTVQIISMRDYGIIEDIPETKLTLEDCALQKARYLANGYHIDCFSEDTGLEVEALNGEPGVYTARYAGNQKSSKDNMNLLLYKLGDTPNRCAQFRTVIALILDKKEYLFEGIIKGKITFQKKGIGGFGYDPIFQPEGYDKTFAELPVEIKNKISHRGKAVRKLAKFLKTYFSE